jgi:hypothetical protein
MSLPPDPGREASLSAAGRSERRIPRHKLRTFSRLAAAGLAVRVPVRSSPPYSPEAAAFPEFHAGPGDRVKSAYAGVANSAAGEIAKSADLG